MILFDEIQKPILADNSDPLSEIPSAYRETISAIAQAQEQRDFQKTLHLSQQLEKKGSRHLSLGSPHVHRSSGAGKDFLGRIHDPEALPERTR